VKKLLSDANWGSSAQALQFVTALKNVQALNDVADHVKNYRPKILVLSGNPSHRQPLVDFANLVTKKLSLLICAHVEKVRPVPGMEHPSVHFSRKW
jgi:solute carrier family 12 sodium/potassium/chloride transporter 2